MKMRTKQKKKKGKKEEKSLLKKIWHFLWESKSFASWTVCLIICFLLVVFVFFPLSSLILSTPLPFVVVESSSMEHKGNNISEWFSIFGDWYREHDINQSNVLEWPFHNGIDKGDIIAVKGLKNIEDYKKGDVIVFTLPGKTPIIHRIISMNGEAATKGDNNDFQLPEEKSIEEEQILGKAIMRIPKLGWVKLYPCSLCPGCCSIIDKIRKV